MTDNLEEIESTLLKNYLKNMDFLKSHDNALYSRVENLSYNLDNEIYEEKYTLEIIEDKLNIVDMENKENLYTQDPYYDAQFKVSRFYPNIQEAISLITTTKIKTVRDPKYVVDSFEYVNEYIDLIKKTKMLENKKFKNIGKYIFIGTLLGIHIEKLHKKIKSRNYLITENSLEVFRLSLFCCDYKKIAKNSNITFLIEVNDLDFRKSLKIFLKYESYYNSIIKYSLSSNNNKIALQKLSEFITLENPLLYSFSDYLGAYGRGVEYIKRDCKILNFQNVYEVFENKSILYIGPGPSLSKQIEFIKKAKKNFILVCLASTLKLLSDNDIVPDIIISIDASTRIVRQFEIASKYYENSVLLVSSKTDTKIVKKLNKKNVYIIQDSIEFFEGFGILTGSSSGEIGYNLCCHFKPKDIYLIGIDVALNQKTKSTHDKSYYLNKKINRDEYIFSDFGELDFDKDIIKVKGNFKDEVYTTRRYLQLIYNYNQVTKDINYDVNLYNLSHGAFLEGIKPLKVKNINLDRIRKIKKSDLYKNMIDTFNKSSKTNLNKEEKKEIKKDKKLTKELLSIIKHCKKRSEFYNIFVKISLKYPGSFVVQMLTLYYNLLNPYVHFLENNEINIQQKVNMIQLEQISKILEFYKCKI
mgnify:CR=1 FL=1